MRPHSLFMLFVLIWMGAPQNASEFTLVNKVITVNGGFGDGGQILNIREKDFTDEVPSNLLEPIDYISNGSVLLRMRPIGLQLDKPGVFKSIRFNFKGFDKPLMFYGLGLGFNGNGESEQNEVIKTFAKINHRFGRVPRDAWRTGLRGLGFKDYSKENKKLGSFGQAGEFQLHLTVVISDRQITDSSVLDYGGLAASALDGVPALADAWRAGDLGAAWAMADRFPEGNEYYTLGQRTKEATDQYAETKIGELTEVFQQNPVAAIQGLVLVQRRLGRHPRSKDLASLLKQWRKSDDVKAIKAPLSMQQKVLGQLEVLRRQMRVIEPLKAEQLETARPIILSLRTMREKHGDSIFYQQLNGLIDELGIRDYVEAVKPDS